MALVTTRNLDAQGKAPRKLPVCHTCLERKEGLFTLDSNGKPQCGDCANRQGRPIPGYAVPHG